MVLMTTKEIPYRLNPIGMVSSLYARHEHCLTGASPE